MIKEFCQGEHKTIQSVRASEPVCGEKIATSDSPQSPKPSLDMQERNDGRHQNLVAVL